MKELIAKALKQYEEELKQEDGNTDAIMFICEEIGNEEGMSPEEFDIFCREASMQSEAIDKKYGY